MNRTLISLIVCCSFFASKLSVSQIQVTFYTTMGNFVAQLEEKKTPVTTANFIKLVNEKFYDSVIFHRVVKNFVIQGGDPTGTGNGGPGYTIIDEFDSMSNVQKTIGMANDGTPNSGGSQFYINLVNNIFLDKKYSVFGKVISNFTVVQNIGKVSVGAADRPVTEVRMDSVRITTPVGITAMSMPGQELTISPHPVTSSSVVSFYTSRVGNVNYKIYNQLGQLVYSFSDKTHDGLNTFSLKMFVAETLPAGLYFLELTADDFKIKKEFVLGAY